MKTALFCLLASLLLLAACFRGGPSDRTATSASMWATVPSATIVRPGTTFTANPNPIIVHPSSSPGKTTLTWHAPVASVEIHVGSAGGKLFASGGHDGNAETGDWVSNNMIFYLQDATAPKPTDRSATLAMLPVAVR